MGRLREKAAGPVALRANRSATPAGRRCVRQRQVERRPERPGELAHHEEGGRRGEMATVTLAFAVVMGASLQT